MKKLYTFLEMNRMLSFLMMGILVCSLFASGKAYGQTVVAINCGSDTDYTALDGTVYAADVYFDGGRMSNSFTGPKYTGDILGTEDDLLYQTYRATGYIELDDFFYNIPLDNGTYNVTLKFADYQQWQRNAGHLIIEGIQLLTNYVVQEEAGEPFTAHDLNFTVNVIDGELNMQFINDELSVGDFFVNGIKITEYATNYVLWSEDFTLADGTMDDAGETAWTAVRENGTFEVGNNMLFINNSGTVGEFTSEVIDISSGPVAISMDVAPSTGIDDGQDYVKLYAIIDGGDPVLLDSIDGEFLHGLGGTALAMGDGAPAEFGQLSGGGLSGSTLQILIKTYLSASSEFYWMDNLSVVEQTLPWIEDFELPNGTKVDDGETAWSAVRESGRFEVEDGKLIINEGGTNPAVFTSEVIEIFGPAVNVSLDVKCSGGLDTGQDFVRLYAIIDGGEEVLLSEIDAGAENQEVKLQGLNLLGNTLQVVIKSFVSAGSELYWMDNLTVEVSAITTYALTTVAANGTITPDPEKDVYEEGTEVTLSVSADYGFKFIGWEGDLSGTDNPATIIMDSEKSVTALFEALPTFTLTTSTTNGSVFVTAKRDVYAEGESVVLEAKPNVGYEFIEWTGDLSGSQNPVTIQMDSNITVTAVIQEIPTYSITVEPATNGSIQLLPNKASYKPGEAVVIAANADAGYRFSAWGGTLAGRSNPTSVVMNEDLTVSVTFELIPPSYTLTIGATTNGSITVDPVGGTYEQGTEVTLTAVPDDGYLFEAWGGDASGTDNPMTITMSADKTVSATFVLETGIELNANQAQPGLQQNYPNPFSYATTIPYQLNEASNVRLSVYNALGQKVSTLVNDYQSAGSYTIDWNAQDASGNQLESGLYIFRLEVGDMVQVKRSSLIR